MGHLCPGLNENTNFTIFRRFAKKNRGRNDFSHFTIFRYFFVFLTQPDGASEVNKIILLKLRKIAAATISPTLRFFVIFYFSHLPDGASEFNKFCEKKGKIWGRNDFSLLTIFRYIWFFLLIRRHFRMEQILRKLKKKSWSQRCFALYDFSLLLCCNHVQERASEFN